MGKLPNNTLFLCSTIMFIAMLISSFIMYGNEGISLLDLILVNAAMAFLVGFSYRFYQLLNAESPLEITDSIIFLPTIPHFVTRKVVRKKINAESITSVIEDRQVFIITCNKKRHFIYKSVIQDMDQIRQFFERHGHGIVLTD